MRFNVRPAVADDLRDLCDLDQIAMSGDSDRIALIRASVAAGQCRLAENDGVIGFVVVAPRHLFGRDFVELCVVHEDHRRRGVGRALMRAAMDHASTPRVFSSTNESNHAMRALFATEGWTLSGHLDGFDDGDPEYVYFIDT